MAHEVKNIYYLALCRKVAELCFRKLLSMELLYRSWKTLFSVFFQHIVVLAKGTICGSSSPQPRRPVLDNGVKAQELTLWKKKKPWCVLLADFCGLDTYTVADFKFSNMLQMAWKNSCSFWLLFPVSRASQCWCTTVLDFSRQPHHCGALWSFTSALRFPGGS